MSPSYKEGLKTLAFSLVRNSYLNPGFHFEYCRACDYFFSLKNDVVKIITTWVQINSYHILLILKVGVLNLMLVLMITMKDGAFLFTKMFEF